MWTMCEHASRYSASYGALAEIFEYLWNWPGLVLSALCFAAGLFGLLQSAREEDALLRRMSAALLWSGAALAFARPLIAAFYFCDKFRALQMIGGLYINGLRILVGACLIGLPAILIGFIAALGFARIFGLTSGQSSEGPGEAPTERIVLVALLSSCLSSFALSSVAGAALCFVFGAGCFVALGKLRSMFSPAVRPGPLCGRLLAASFAGAVAVGALLL